MTFRINLCMFTLKWLSVYYIFCSSSDTELNFWKRRMKSSESEQVTQRNVTLIVRKAQNPIFISAVFCLKYCQSRKGSKLNNWELIAPAKRLNQNCDAYFRKIVLLSRAHYPVNALWYMLKKLSLSNYFVTEKIHKIIQISGFLFQICQLFFLFGVALQLLA